MEWNRICGTYKQRAPVDDLAVYGALSRKTLRPGELRERVVFLGAQRQRHVGIVRIAEHALHCADSALSDEFEVDDQTEERRNFLEDEGRFEDVADGVDKNGERGTRAGRCVGFDGVLDVVCTQQ